jgi:hypothetical protein
MSLCSPQTGSAKETQVRELDQDCLWLLITPGTCESQPKAILEDGMTASDLEESGGATNDCQRH